MIDSFTYNGLVEHLDGVSEDVDKIFQDIDWAMTDELMEIKKRLDFRVGALKCILSIMRIDKSQEALFHLRQ
jgi:hypothetical protein